MTLLRLIWLTSLALALAAIAGMMALIVARLLTSYLAKRRAVERRRLLPLLLGQEEGDVAVLRARPTLVADLYLELIQLVRGEERQRFVERAASLGIADKLARRVRRGSQRRRIRAVHALAEFDLDPAREALRDALNDRHQDVRLAAALALAEQGERFDAEQLTGQLHLRSGEPSLLVISLFRRMAETQPDQIRAYALEPDKSAQFRLAAVEALATTGDYSLVPTVVESALNAEDGSEELPRYLHMLGKLGHPAARPAILAGLTRRSMAARAAAAGAAGRIRLRESADPLMHLLDDEEWWVRFRAGEALIQLGEPGVERLRTVCATGSARAREAAETMLAEYKVDA